MAGPVARAPMDGLEKEQFLASIDREIDSEDEVEVIGDLQNPIRRLSASSAGLALRRKSREEVGDTPQPLSRIKPPPNSVPDLGESFLINPPPDPVPLTPTATPRFTTSSPAAGSSPGFNEDGSPRTNRSGRKRPFPGPDSKSKRKMATKGKDDEDPFAKLAKMMKSIESKIEQAEVRMTTKIDGKIDSLAADVCERLNRTEQTVAELQGELGEVRKVANEKNIARLVNQALAARPADPSREPRQRPRPLGRQDGTNDLAVFRGLAETSEVADGKREERYLLARRQLRLWPISHTSDLVASVTSFLSERLLISEQRLASLSFTVEPLLSRPESPEQVLVTFHTVRQRDEVRAKAANLRGADRGVGCQLEPPDHLRTQYQAFQNLAFCLKKKNPDLKQNIKFDDRQQCLIMDVKTLDGWKTIEYEAARETLRGRTRRSGSISGRELKSILNTSDVVDSDTSMNEVDDTVVENTTENDNISNNLSLRTIAFLNTNARSLGPKITSLADCFEEKRLDLATVTETWFQSDRLRQELEQEMTDKHALCIISRERSRAAANGRQYGGVAMVFRRRTCKFDVFPLVNDDDHEVLAAVGKITGIKGKVFCLSCYAPPNLTVTQARSMIEYVSDVIGEAKRSFAECTIIVNGDFNQWPFEELLDDHPDMRELDHGPTRDDRKIDRSFTNFHRSIKESCTLSPLETEAGAVSDHKMVFALAEFPSVAKEMITYTYRKFTEQGADNFVRECRLQTWDTVVGALTVDGKVEAFDKIMNENMDKFFPFVTVTRKASDPPWMNDNIRRLQRKRRKIYDRHGRSRRWRRLKKL